MKTARALRDQASSLPIARTSLIGRDVDVRLGQDLLLERAAPLLTLTGPGGVGKTRLALAITQEVAAAFADGVTFVDLSPLTDATLVPSAVAHALGLTEVGDGSLTEQLVAVLHTQQHLLILDNCEHLIEASALLAASLLTSCPALQVLATSRAPLHVRGERDVPVSPLALSKGGAPSPLEDVLPPAVALFVDRAQAADSRFVLSQANVDEVIKMCHRLDGLPLAIELAAAWSKVLPLSDLHARLDNRLLGLTGGTRDLPARQQTLRATIAWSYDLLSPEAQRLFRHLAVFAGAFDLAAVEAIAATDDDQAQPVLENLAQVVDASLLERTVRASSDGKRYRLLETIRAFAHERLAVAGDEVSVRQAHAAYFLKLAETAQANLKGPDQIAWLDRLEAEHDNLRAALAWSIEREGETALRLAGALSLFWDIRGHLTEGVAWLERALAAGGLNPTAARARVLREVAWHADDRGEHERAEALCSEALIIARELGDRRAIAGALHILGGIALMQGKQTQAAALFEENLTLCRTLGNQSDVAHALMAVGRMAQERGELERAAARFEESLALFRALEDQHGAAAALFDLGWLALSEAAWDSASAHLEQSLSLYRTIGNQASVALTLDLLGEVVRGQGELAQSAALHQEALTIFQEVGARWGVADALDNLGRVASAQGDFGSAVSLHRQALEIYQELGIPRGIVYALRGLAAAAAAGGQPTRAARLYGAADAARDIVGVPMLTADLRADYERSVTLVRDALREDAFTAAWSAGRVLSPEEIAAEAFALAAAAASRPVRDTAESTSAILLPTVPLEDPYGLSPRERDVLALLCQRLTNKEIAERLFVGTRTVQTHTISIFTKLGVENRRDAAAFAARHGLA